MLVRKLLMLLDPFQTELKVEFNRRTCRKTGPLMHCNKNLFLFVEFRF